MVFNDPITEKQVTLGREVVFNRNAENNYFLHGLLGVKGRIAGVKNNMLGNMLVIVDIRTASPNIQAQYGYTVTVELKMLSPVHPENKEEILKLKIRHLHTRQRFYIEHKDQLPSWEA